MNNFEYWSPTRIFFGKDAEDNIGEVIKSNGYKNVLVHYGGGSVERSGLLEKIRNMLISAGVSYVELGGVEPNPKIGLVREGVSLCKMVGVDFILAVGGGSVIDSAKAIGLGLSHDRDPWEMISGAIPAERSFPVGAVPTFAAAGSEMSRTTVITNPAGPFKRSYGSDFIRTTAAFMNPVYSYTLPAYQTACGVVDIIMHTLEAYFTKDRDTSVTDGVAEGLMSAVIAAGRVAMADPENYEARAALLWASGLSINGPTRVGKQSTFPCHRIAHDVSGLFDHVAHGAALSVIFPAWAKYVYKNDIRKFCQYATNVWGLSLDYDHTVRTAASGIDATEAFFKSLGMPTTFGELGITDEESFEAMANLTTNDGETVVNSYVPIGKAELLELYRLAM